MITEEEFDRVQKLLGRKGRPRPKRHRFAFTGLMNCGTCGAMITAEEKIKHQKMVMYIIMYTIDAPRERIQTVPKRLSN